MKIGLQLKIQLENVSKIIPEGCNFRWYIKIRCTNCGEESKWVYIIEEERVPIKGSRGDANLVIRCKICNRENSLDIEKGSVCPYTCDSSGSFSTIVVFECRGIEVTDFDPRCGFTVLGEEEKTVFSNVDLSEREWFEYDERMQKPVSITELEHKFIRL